MKIVIVSAENIKSARRIADEICDHIEKEGKLTKYIRLTEPVNSPEDLTEDLLDDIKDSYRIDDYDYFVIPAKSFIPDCAGTPAEKTIVKNVSTGDLFVAYLTSQPTHASSELVKSATTKSQVGVFMQPATHGEEKRIAKEIFTTVY